MVYLDPKLAVAAIVPIDGRILLAKRGIHPGFGKWGFPAGYVNRGEIIEEALAREVKEETGLDVKVGWLVGMYSWRDRAVVLGVYEATPTGGQMAPLSETLEIDLFPYDRLPELAFEDDREILIEWQQGRLLKGS